MDQLRAPQSSLPEMLYRVQYAGTPTKFTPSTGFEARDTTSFYNDAPHFKESVIQAFHWRSKHSSPFIACFSEKEHAEKWMLHFHKDDRKLYSIHTGPLHNTYVFRLSTLVEELGIEVPRNVVGHAEGAWLCLHRIPSNAVEVTESVDDVKANGRWDPRHASSVGRGKVVEDGGDDDAIEMLDGWGYLEEER